MNLIFNYVFGVNPLLQYLADVFNCPALAIFSAS